MAKAKAKAITKKYATAAHPMMKATLKALFRFANKDQALVRLNQLKEQFVGTKHVPVAEDAAVIWVRGYGLSESDKDKGYLGKFVMIRIEKDPIGYFTLKASKLEAELKFHPQRKRPVQHHPDWGHPILRGIKKRRLFFTIDEAQGELMRLHEQFPEVSIPDEHRLLIMIYEKVAMEKSPIQKYRLEIKALQEGGYIIEPHRKKQKIEVPSALSHKPAAATAGEPAGYFSAMVTIKKRKKPVRQSAATMPTASNPES